MTSYRFTEYPPGTTFFTPGELDELGNWKATAPPQPITSNPSTGQELAEPVPPVVATEPEPVIVTPVPGTPGQRVLAVEIKEGIRTFDGDYKIHSTGKISPRSARGWSAAANAIGSDDVYAATNLPDSGFCPELVLSGLSVPLPEGAEITGIKVFVERNKI